MQLMGKGGGQKWKRGYGISTVALVLKLRTKASLLTWKGEHKTIKVHFISITTNNNNINNAALFAF